MNFYFIVPGAVVNLQIQSMSSTWIMVSWSIPVNVECQPVSYTVEHELTNIDQCFQVTNGQIIPVDTTSDLSYSVTGLTSYSTYTVYVTPRTGAVNGIRSGVPGTTEQTGDCYFV